MNDVIDGFTVVQVLGSGQAGGTFLVRRSIGAEDVVLKYCRPQSLEAEVLQQVSHPGVCQLVGRGGAATSAYLLLSNYGQRTLQSCVEQGISVQTLRGFILQISAALEALHADGFAHGDLRPEHVLIAPNQQAVLIDLHCAYRWNDEFQESDYNAGSLAYLSPERI